MIPILWTAVSLGSCTFVQAIDNRSNNYLSMEIPQEISGCGEFSRQPRIGHHRPDFPKVDISRLRPDEVADVLLTYTEKLKRYVDNEEIFLNEDILHHNQKCPEKAAVFLKKDHGYIMSIGAMRDDLDKVE